VRTVTIGQGPHCDIVITDDPYVSTHHARLMLGPHGWLLADAGSTNGTRVIRNGVTYPVTLGAVFPLAAGDVVVVGRTPLPPFTPHDPTTNPTTDPTATPR
jgi:pSer/pThr/pTyr-binding forkhead associated (FHA) protein